MKDILIRLRRPAEIAVWALFLAAVSQAATWTEPASQLAARIAEISGQTAVHVTYRNAASLPASQFQDFTRELEGALRARGIRLVTGSAGLDVTVTASENPGAHVFVAQTQQGRELKTVIVSSPKETAAVAQSGGSAVTLRKALLIEQDEPLLDVLLMDGGAQLVALGPSRATVYKRNGEQWQMQGIFEMPHSRPWPLDVRGRLTTTGNNVVEAYLPGVVCTSQTLTPLVMSCRSADDPWPLGEKQAAFYNGARNYFNGVMSPGPGASMEPFYTAVALPRANGVAWVMTGVDGRVRISDGKDVSLVRAGSAVREWGSDIAALNGCGRGTLIVASGANDASMPDALRAYEMPEREPAAVSAPLDVPGPVTALWAQPDKMSVIAVSHSLVTGKYDAYSVSATCNQ